MISRFKGEMVIDHERGVIYVHCNRTGRTLLRICNIPKPVPALGEFGAIDLTHMKSITYAVPKIEVES
jgi:hypothetical protein